MVLRFIDNQLNRVTMYRLVLYNLIGLLVIALVFSLTGVLAYDPFALLISTSFLLAVGSLVNWVFARVFGVATNVESVYISALILVLIITPIQSLNDLWFLGWAAVWAMASKYILAVRGKHVFNPAAFAVALTYFTINQSASWWVGDARMLPFVLVGGLLVVRKLRRFDMVLSFLITAVVMDALTSVLGGMDLLTGVQQEVLYSPLFFFAFVMLTEPLTAPSTRRRRVIYAALVGILFTPSLHVGGLFITPELALLAGNLYSFAVSPKGRFSLVLKEKVRIAPDAYEFVFATPKPLAYQPGQYMEWTLGHRDPDVRGNRRFFTLASAPTESSVKLGVRFYSRSSTFKKALLDLKDGQAVAASQLAGDFVLPRDPRQRCVFIAGGIGVTPFRSMIQYLLDTHHRRPIVLFYANRTAADIVYKNVFDQAERELGIKTIYSLTDTRNPPPHWEGRIGRITSHGIQKAVPGYQDCLFYISGPMAMVDATRQMLRKMGINPGQIKTDYFVGL